MTKRKEPTKEERIKREIKRLDEIFRDLDQATRASLDALIRRAAYMRVTLEDYEKDLDEKGYVEMFTQSERTPPYERERPVARLYNSMMRNFQSIMKQLSDSVPDSVPEDVAKEIAEFIG